MTKHFLQTMITRHLQETGSFLKKLHKYENVSLREMADQDIIKPDQMLFKILVEGARPFGEVILHMIRSLEFYVVGIMENRWEPLTYNLMEFSTIPEIILLYESVSSQIISHMESISEDILSEVVNKFNRSTSKAELLLEMVEHSIHHRGQLSVYFRLLSIEPANISYIV